MHPSATPGPPAPTARAGPTADADGGWVLQADGTLQGWPPGAAALRQQIDAAAAPVLPQETRAHLVQRTGRQALDAGRQALDFLQFVGDVALGAAGLLRHPRRWPWRTLLHELQVGGSDALPIVGLTSFLLGVAVAYQGADQLRHYGANVFVVELVGYAMLREFAPLIGAIIIAGRSGSAHAALIGLGKSLVFALIIVLIGCFQGLRTRGSAASVGRQTTLSVVQAIFLVIVVDALFSMAFNGLDL